MVIAVLALVVALGGTAIAGGVLTTKKFRNQALRGPVTYVTAFSSIPVNNTTGINVAAACPPGTFVVGGGIKLGNDQVQLVNDSHPVSSGWAGTVFNFGTVAHSANTTAVCVFVKSTTGSVPAS